MEAGTAIAVGQVSAKVLSIIWTYFSDLKDARDDIHSLMAELQDLQHVALKVQDIIAKPSRAMDMSTSTMLFRTLDKTLSEIKDLHSQLDPGEGKTSMKRMGKRALKWPFSKKEVDKRIGRL